MEWVLALNKSIEYIENNLDGEIDIRKAAECAACSVFHYQRMFAYITGITLNEYIRRRRMTAAAFDLINNNAKVIDVALKYGYESPTAFNRAFRSIHNISPSQAKKEGNCLTSFPRITFSMQIKGEEAMNFKIVTKESFRIVGYVTRDHMTMEDSFEKVTKFWETVTNNGGILKLCGLMNGKEPKGILGVSACDGGVFSGYYIAVATDEASLDGMEEYTVPKMTYAVFECIGAIPEAIQNTQKRIISEWLPTSGYEYAEAPDIEVYPEGDILSKDYRSEIWMPVVKKS